MPVTKAMRLLVDIKGYRNEVMIRLAKGGNYKGSSDVGAR